MLARSGLITKTLFLLIRKEADLFWPTEWEATMPGEVASKIAVDTVHDYLKDIIDNTEDDEMILSALDTAVIKAHEAIKEKAD